MRLNRTSLDSFNTFFYGLTLMETFPFFSKVLFQIMIFIITFDLFNLAIFFNYSVLYPYRFQRECLCLCHSSSRCGARSGQRVLDGQTEGLQL